MDVTDFSTQTLYAEALRRESLRHYATDPLALGRTIFPHHFRFPTQARWHREAIELLTGLWQGARVREWVEGVGHSTSLEPDPVSPPHIFSEKNSDSSAPDSSSQSSPLHVTFHAPRGHAKSTLASFLLPIWSMLLDRKHFMLLISNTHAQAVKFLQAIKYEWETNTALMSLVPAIRPNREKWSDSDIELFRDGQLSYKLLALGSGHQLRGLKFLHWRTHLIVLDDTEDDEMVRSDLRRLSHQEWFDHVVLKVDPQCDVVMLGTIIHEHSLLNRLVRQRDPEDQHRYQEWIRRLYVAVDAQGASTWPERESTEELLHQREVNPYSFSQEKQGEPVDPSYCPFKTEFFTERRFWTELPAQLSISVTIDPAWTIRDYSKETALVCAGWDDQSRLWVLDTHHAKYDDPSLILDLILDWYLRWTKQEQVHPGHRFFCVGFDTVSAQKMLLTSFRDRCRARNLHPHLRELKADRDKIRRIWQLEPLFRQERIFLRPDMTYLQAQLQGFPRNVQGGLVDVADALAYHLQLEPYRPTPSATPAPSTGMKLSEYVQMHEDIQAYLHAFPDGDWLGRADSALLSQWIRPSRP